MKVIFVLFAIFGLSYGAPKLQGLVAQKVNPKSLIDDLAEIVALIPLDDILAIDDEHLQTDGAFVAVIDYLQGTEWADLVAEVGSKPAVQDLVKYLEDAGLPVDLIIAAIHDLIANAVPGTDPDEEGSLRPLLDEVEGIIPFDAIAALIKEKLASSPDFQDLYVEISSEDAKALVEEVRAIPEVQRLAQRLRDFGADIDGLLAIIYNFLGWGEPKKF